MVIDTVYNTSIRERYADIHRLEAIMKIRNKEMPDNVILYLHSNPIIVIGTTNEKTINSMFRYGGEEEDFLSIPDIDYEMWFFYNH